MVQIESKLRIIANRNFNQTCIAFSTSDTSAAVSARGYNFANSPHQPIERFIWFGRGAPNHDWIEENGHRRVGRREFDDTRNRSILQATKCAEDFG